MQFDNSALFSLKNKAVVLTGAAGFFGRYFVQALSSFGAELFLLDGSKEGLERVGDSEARRYVIDQYDHDAVTAVYSQIWEECPVDVVINNSFDWKRPGFGDQSARLETANHAQFMAGLESGAYWPFQAIQFFGPRMKARGHGTILNISSMYSLVSPDPKLYEGTDYFNPAVYGAAKAATNHLTRYAASWLAPEVRVNALAPGAIPNVESQSNNSSQNEDAEFMDRLAKRAVLDRVGHPTDLVGPLIFLCSEASRFMTGQVLVVDGGWTII